MPPPGSRFPDPRWGPGDAPLAWGGDLETETLLDAYRHGIFCWPDGRGMPLWWSPDPRAVIPLDELHISRSLRRTLRSDRFHCTVDEDFTGVIHGCADRSEGTWITPEMVSAYTRLHRLGIAHSVEVTNARGRLVGGVYGLALGGAFMGESMFSRATDASKVALVHLVERLDDGGFVLFDVQLSTPHLRSMGAVEMSRDDYLVALAEALRHEAWLGPAQASVRHGDQQS